MMTINSVSVRMRPRRTISISLHLCVGIIYNLQSIRHRIKTYFEIDVLDGWHHE